MIECWGPGLYCAQRTFGRSAQKPKELQKTRCTGVLSGTGRQALTSTKFGQRDLWTVRITSVHHLYFRDHARRQERSPRVPVIVAERCLQKQGSDSVTPQEIHSVFLVQNEDRQSSERAQPGNCCSCGLELKLQSHSSLLGYFVAVTEFLCSLRLIRLSEAEAGDAEESWRSLANRI
ncbi:hypothetical protein NDU88_001995 [Pleurodeles waltl]|uniref:Uncharacterized protein n=1 Tax=Pleurodeles waltl TaxID=8319 RepID=A0AAV7T172_PLEWA|nr:hypothetical protein NDU88_001995 [Pleurodeles waltl]